MKNRNITSKKKVGDYSYNGVQPHAVMGVTNPDGLISTQPQVISYTSFNKVSEINENNNGKNLLITYGADKQRIKTVMKSRGVVKQTKYFAFGGNYEKIIDHISGNVQELCYLPGLKGYAAIYETNSADQTQKLHYVHQDRQGSIQSITNESGGIEEELSFDAWGNRRNATDWSFNNLPTSFMFDRGYTGHEMLDVFGLINMNGRMNDPKLGRMLSPDIVVQDGGNTQCYNRYSYCVNNPLAYTDPSGYKWKFWKALVGDILTGGLISSSAALFAPTVAANASNDYISGFFSTSSLKNRFTAGDKRAHNSLSIDVGVFKYDTHYSGKGDFWRDTWQLASKPLWTPLGTSAGNLRAHNENWRGNIEGVYYVHGATVMDVKNINGTTGQMLGGSYIRVKYYVGIDYDKNIDYKTFSNTLVHEYGHYRQSQIYGDLSIILAINSWKHPSKIDDYAWNERDAQDKGFEYMINYYSIQNYHYYPNIFSNTYIIYSFNGTYYGTRK